MNMGSAISYIFSKMGSIGQIFKGLSYFGNGGIGKSFSVIGQNGSHFDMRQGQETVYTGWSLMWWVSTISVVLLQILNWIFIDFTIGSIITMLIGPAIGLAVYAFFITKGTQNETHWAAWAVKGLMIIHLLSLIGYIGLICANVIGAIISLIGSIVFLGGSYLIFSILGILINFLVNVANICLAFYILNGLNQACVTNYNQNMGYNPNMQNGYDMNNGYNPNYNPNMQNGFNPNAAGVAGLGAINTVKNQSIGQETADFNPNNQGNNFNQNNGYNQQNNFNPNMNNGYNQQGYGQQNMNPNNQNVQMYACPYCGGAITHSTTPCPHCNNPINWGM